MNNRFLQALAEQRRKSEIVNPLIAGSLGITLNGVQTVECPDRASFVYVQVRSSEAEVIQAFNDQVAPVFGLPVYIQWQGNRYVVTGRDTMRYSNWQDNSAFLPRHASTHEFRGSAGDVVFVAPEQFLPLMPQPSGSIGARSLLINDYNAMLTTGSFVYVPQQSTQDLVAWHPSTTGAVMVLVMMDALNGNLNYVVGSGSIFSNALTGTADVLPHIPVVPDISRYLPIAAVRLVASTTFIGWDNIYDVRPFMGTYRGTVGGGGGGGFTPQGTGTFLAIDASNGPLRGPLVIQQGFPNQINQYFDYSSLVAYSSGMSGPFFGAAAEVVNWSTGSRGYGLYIDDEQGGANSLYVFDNGTFDKGTFLIDQYVDFRNPAGRYFFPMVDFERHGGNSNIQMVGSLLKINDQDGAHVGSAFQFEIDVQNGWYTYFAPGFTGQNFFGYPFPSYANYYFDTYNILLSGSALSVWNHNTQAMEWLMGNGDHFFEGIGVLEHTGTNVYTRGQAIGQGTLVNGTLTIPNVRVTASSRIFLTVNAPGTGTVGSPYVKSRLAGSGFTIMSTSLSDNSRVAYLIIEPHIGW